MSVATMPVTLRRRCQKGHKETEPQGKDGFRKYFYLWLYFGLSRVQMWPVLGISDWRLLGNELAKRKVSRVFYTIAFSLFALL